MPLGGGDVGHGQWRARGRNLTHHGEPAPSQSVLDLDGVARGEFGNGLASGQTGNFFLLELLNQVHVRSLKLKHLLTALLLSDNFREELRLFRAQHAVRQ